MFRGSFEQFFTYVGLADKRLGVSWKDRVLQPIPYC